MALVGHLLLGLHVIFTSLRPVITSFPSVPLEESVRSTHISVTWNHHISVTETYSLSKDLGLPQGECCVFFFFLNFLHFLKT